MLFHVILLNGRESRFHHKNRAANCVHSQANIWQLLAVQFSILDTNESPQNTKRTFRLH